METSGVYRIFQPAIQDELSHVIVSPNNLEAILLHFCPWKHFEARLCIHSVNASYISCQIKLRSFNLECEIASNMASVFSSPTLLCMKIFLWKLLLNTVICSWSPRHVIQNQTLLSHCLATFSAFSLSEQILKDQA